MPVAVRWLSETIHGRDGRCAWPGASLRSNSDDPDYSKDFVVSEPRTVVSAPELPIAVGAETSLVRTISEFDVQHFARLTGDFSAVHIDDVMMSQSIFGRTIVHGALLVGLMSAASTLFVESLGRVVSNETPVSLGYDRVRFVAPVFANQTVRIAYRIVGVDHQARRASADVRLTEEQSGEVIAVATNILKWVKNPVANNV